VLDEALFHLSVYVNLDHWGTENPYIIYQILLHDQKVGYGVL